MKLNYEWKLSETIFTKDQGKVFSCFSCGGGSTMGYKLAGFDVIGFNEIDPKMAECYIKNHNPKYSYVEPIQKFKLRNDLPEELYNLDILDGSPPCSSFSIAGNREKDWGKEKKFKEGQKEQILDTLFFDFIDLAKKLKPKIVLAENVKGIIQGDAKSYVNKILLDFDKAGYYVDYKLLDASKMGIPQKRERVFFYAVRKDLYKGLFTDLFMSSPRLDLEFNECPILFSQVVFNQEFKKKLSPSTLKYWLLKNSNETCMGETTMRIDNKRKFFNNMYYKNNSIPYTISAKYDTAIVDYEPRYLNKTEVCRIQSYPLDYDFNGVDYHYMCGMSVPPLMTARIVNEIKKQWLEQLK